MINIILNLKPEVIKELKLQMTSSYIDVICKNQELNILSLDGSKYILYNTKMLKVNNEDVSFRIDTKIFLSFIDKQCQLFVSDEEISIEKSNGTIMTANLQEPSLKLFEGIVKVLKSEWEPLDLEKYSSIVNEARRTSKNLNFSKGTVSLDSNEFECFYKYNKKIKDPNLKFEMLLPYYSLPKNFTDEVKFYIVDDYLVKSVNGILILSRYLRSVTPSQIGKLNKSKVHWEGKIRGIAIETLSNDFNWYLNINKKELTLKSKTISIGHCLNITSKSSPTEDLDIDSLLDELGENSFSPKIEKVEEIKLFIPKEVRPLFKRDFKLKVLDKIVIFDFFDFIYLLSRSE